MPLLQKLLVSGFAPSLGKTLGTFHKALTELTIGSFFLSLLNFFRNTILNPLGCLYIATSPLSYSSSLSTYTNPFASTPLSEDSPISRSFTISLHQLASRAFSGPSI